MHTKYAAHCGKQLVKSIIIVHHKCIRKTLINHRQKSCERNNLLHHRTDLVPWRPLAQLICTHYFCFENMGRFVTLKKIRS